MMVRESLQKAIMGVQQTAACIAQIGVAPNLDCVGNQYTY